MAKKNDNGFSVVISGTAPKGYTYLSVQVLKPGISPDTVIPAAQLSEKVVFQDQTYSEADRSYSVGFYMPSGSPSGEYAVKVKYAMGESANLSFTYYDESTFEAQMNVINTSGSVSTVKAAIEGYGLLLGLDMDLYAKTGASASGAIEKFMSYRTSGHGYADTEEMKAGFTQACVVQLMIDSSAEEFGRFTNGEYSAVTMLLSQPAYTRFLPKLSSTDISRIISSMVADDSYTSLEEVQEEFEIQTLLSMISHKDTWYDTKEVIENFGALLGVDMDVFENTDNRDEICKALYGKLYTRQTFLTAYKAALLNAQGGSGSGSGNGGGGSGGGGGSITIPYQPPAETGNDGEAEPQAPFSVFVDVNEKAPWAVESVNFLYQKGIVNGRDGLFEPDKNVTREEFAKMIILAVGEPELYGESGFEDVDPGSWYGRYVSSAKEIGVINGVSESAFGVGQNITRQDMAAMVYRAGKLLGVTKGLEAKAFADSAAIADYAKEAVES